MKQAVLVAFALSFFSVLPHVRVNAQAPGGAASGVVIAKGVTFLYGSEESSSEINCGKPKRNYSRGHQKVITAPDTTETGMLVLDISTSGSFTGYLVEFASNGYNCCTNDVMWEFKHFFSKDVSPPFKFEARQSGYDRPWKVVGLQTVQIADIEPGKPIQLQLNCPEYPVGPFSRGSAIDRTKHDVHVPIAYVWRIIPFSSVSREGSEP